MRSLAWGRYIDLLAKVEKRKGSPARRRRRRRKKGRKKERKKEEKRRKKKEERRSVLIEPTPPRIVQAPVQLEPPVGVDQASSLWRLSWATCGKRGKWFFTALAGFEEPIDVKSVDNLSGEGLHAKGCPGSD